MKAWSWNRSVSIDFGKWLTRVAYAAIALLLLWNVWLGWVKSGPAGALAVTIPLYCAFVLGAVRGRYLWQRDVGDAQRERLDELEKKINEAATRIGEGARKTEHRFNA